MTTEYKITRADLTADASQNCEPFVADLTQEAPASSHPPLGRKRPAPAKPAHTPLKHKRDVILELYSSPDAVLNALHQAGWEIVPQDQTRLVATSKVDELLQELTETAAERDRLRVQHDDAVGRLASVLPKLKAIIKERDQVREQVRTLLAFTNSVADLDLAAVNCGMIPGETWKAIHAAARAAVKSVESEQAK